MKYMVGALTEAVEVVKSDQKVWGLYLLFGLLPFFASFESTPPIIDLALAFLSLGWYASRFVYLHRVSQKKDLELHWYKVLENILSNALKLFPVLLILLAAILIPLVSVGLWYGRWFAASYLNEGLGLTTRQVMSNLMIALFNPSLWGEFFSQNLLMVVIYQFFQLCVLVGILVSKIIMILLVVEQFSVRDSIIKGFYYLNNRMVMLASFIGFRVGINMLLYVIQWVLDVSHGQASKHVAVLEWCKYMGIDPQRMMGIGDSYNDYPLLSACGYKVATADAPRELKEIADQIVPSARENGILDILKRL